MQYRPRPNNRKPRPQSGWNRAGDLAIKAINRHNVAPQINAAAVCTAAGSISRGEYIPVSWKDHTLKLVCNDYEAVISVRRREAEIIASINNILQTTAVNKLVLTLS